MRNTFFWFETYVLVNLSDPKHIFLTRNTSFGLFLVRNVFFWLETHVLVNSFVTRNTVFWFETHVLDNFSDSKQSFLIRNTCFGQFSASKHSFLTRNTRFGQFSDSGHIVWSIFLLRNPFFCWETHVWVNFSCSRHIFPIRNTCFGQPPDSLGLAEVCFELLGFAVVCLAACWELRGFPWSCLCVVWCGVALGGVVWRETTRKPKKQNCFMSAFFIARSPSSIWENQERRFSCRPWLAVLWISVCVLKDFGLKSERPKLAWYEPTGRKPTLPHRPVHNSVHKIKNRQKPLQNECAYSGFYG